MTMFNEYTLVFDIDGTICPIKKPEERYEDLIPYQPMVEKMRYYKESGARIVLYGVTGERRPQTALREDE